MRLIFQSAFDLIMFLFEFMIDSEFFLWFIGCCMIITAFNLLGKIIFHW